MNGGSRLGWYVRRATAMSPAEVAWRVRDQALRAWWSRRQVRPGQLGADPPSPGELQFAAVLPPGTAGRVDRKSTRLNSSHVEISYAVFCLKKKTTQQTE